MYCAGHVSLLQVMHFAIPPNGGVALPWGLGPRSSSVVQVLNETYSEGLREALSRPGTPCDDAAFISIDRLGADVRVRRATDYIVERLAFATVRAEQCG